MIVAGPDEQEAIERFRALVLEELNVREVRFVSDADELGRWELKPNYRALGPSFGKHMPIVAAAVAGLDPARVRSGGPGGHLGRWARAHARTRRPADGPTAARGLPAGERGTHAVALNLELDDDLRREGLAREIVHAVQSARKSAGLRVEDRISLTLGGDAELVEAARAHEGYVSGETLATSLGFDSAEAGESATIDGRELRIGVSRA